ncbi:hypothetical protein [Niveispirillum fermenti]|uniref:hypothetical protein n=1 Tax=Niveispirillum fermenti TaxID=1233113 RepID=UPI003A87B577
MTGISSYASYLNLVRTVTGGQRNIDTLSQQLSSGKQSTDVAFYGVQTQRLLDLRTELVRRQSYTQVIDQTSTRVQSYNTIMERMADMASELTSTTRLPAGPGAVRVSTVNNATAGSMKVSVDLTNSRFMAEATYTVSAIPSRSGPPGSFDVTVSDGLGGVATNTINLKQVPPQVDADRFTITGGPGDGAIVKLNIEKLEGSGISSFDVSWPELTATKEIIKGMTAELQSLLNQKVGDRYLFAGSRYDTVPVGDLISAKQINRVTLVGERGDVGTTYEMTLNGKRFTYVTTGQEQSLNEALTNSTGTGLVDQIKAYQPPLNVTASVLNGVVTVTGNDPKEGFTLATNVYEPGRHNNRIEASPLAIDGDTAPFTIQTASETQEQIDHVKLHGAEADVGDVFNISIGARTIVQNDGAPEQVVIAGPTEYSYVVGPKDFDEIAAMPAPQPSMSAFVATKLMDQINADGTSPVVASIDPADDTNIVLTAKENNSQFQTEASINNAGNRTMLVNNKLPPLAEHGDFTSTTRPPDLPFYDTQYAANATSTAAYDIARVQVDDGYTVSYGVTSNDPAIQKLVNALRSLTAAVARPGEYSQRMNEARDVLTGVTGELRGAQARVANANTAMENVRSRHQDALTKAKNELAGIEGIDENEVAVRLKAAMSSQEATYTVASRANSLSLINFLT